MKMKYFKKFSYDEFEEVYVNGENQSDYLCGNVAHDLYCNSKDYWYSLLESLIDCESPIEQVLAMEFERIGLWKTRKFNPYVDVVQIEKQATINCGDSEYRVDFLIPVWYLNQGGIMFVVECDGHEFHQKTKEQVERDNKRTRDLQKNGYEVIRFSGTEIYHGAHQCALEVLKIILSKCEYKKEV